MKHLAWFLPFWIFVTLGTASTESDPPTVGEAKARFEKIDRQLNDLWAMLKEKLPPARFATVKDDQRGWLEYRDRLALSPSYSGAPSDEKAARQSREYYSTAASLMEDRILWLNSWLAEEPASLTGSWTDSHGGSIEIVERDGQIFFLIQVVRGPTAHVGALSGVARWNSPIGWFSDKGREKDKEDETNLAFHLEGGGLTLRGANTSFYHGARAYFDGDYRRTGELDGRRQTDVVKMAKAGEVPE